MHAIAWKSFWQERSFLATKMPALEAYCSDMCSDNVAVKLGDQRLRTTSGRDWLPSLSTTVLFHTHLHAWTTLAYEVALRLVDAGNQFWIKNATLLWYYAHVGAWKQDLKKSTLASTNMHALDACCSDMCSTTIEVKPGDQRLRTTSGCD